MVVLDEQLLGRGIEREIATWYPGNVKFIIDLRPERMGKVARVADGRISYYSDDVKNIEWV